jgi:arginyl-tRNA synthetase
MGNTKLDENGNLLVKDYIADKTYFLPNSSFITRVEARDEVCPPYGHDIDYLKYKVKRRQKIERNNSILKEEFDTVKSLVEFIDKTEENLFLLKVDRPFDLIQSMRNFGITDLYGFSKNTEEVITQIKNKCLKLMRDAADEAILKLNIERDKFLAESDLDSVEEVDLIIQMISNEVTVTTFEDLQKPEDIYALWPPILLPVPF